MNFKLVVVKKKLVILIVPYSNFAILILQKRHKSTTFHAYTQICIV